MHYSSTGMRVIVRKIVGVELLSEAVSRSRSIIYRCPEKSVEVLHTLFARNNKSPPRVR